MADVVLSRYRIDRRLGHGGMGEVYAATDLRLDRPVALKFCLPSSASENARRQIEREARAASRLHHTNIATIFDYEEDETGRPFIVMELVEGVTLAARLRDGPIPVIESLRIARDVAAALEEAHHQGFLHRDIKPANICLTPRGSAKVLDFGLARRNQHDPESSSDETVTTSIHGTPAYMSPEQAQGKDLNQCSDLFSLGAVLYECLTGESAFGASTHTASLLRVIRDDPPAPSTRVTGVTAEIDILLKRLLDKEPANRPQGAGEVRQYLDSILGTPRSSQALPPATPRTFPGLARSRPSWLAPALIVGLILVCAGAWWTWQNRQPTALPPAARQWYEDGIRALHDGTFWRASKLLDAAVQEAPNYAPSRARLAEAWLELDDVQRARQQILLATPAGSSLDNHPRPDRLIISAIHHAVTGQNEQAVADYQQLVKVVDPPRRGSASLELGRALERAQRRKEATAAYQEAIRLDPSLAAAHLRLGRAYSRDSNFGEAEKELAAAESLYRTSNNLEGVTEVLYQRAQTAVRRERYDEATTHIAQVLELAKATGNIQQSVAVLLQRVTIEIAKGRPADAEATAKSAVDLARQSSAAILVTRAMIDLGTTFLVRRQFAQAESFLNDALNSARLNSDARSEARALANLGSLHQLNGKPKEAVESLEPALAYYEKNFMRIEARQVRLMVARTKRQLGDYTGARASFETLLDEARAAGNRGHMALAEEGLGFVGEQQQRHREAFEHYRAAAEYFTPQNSIGFINATLGMSGAVSSLGHLTEAEGLARRALGLAVETKNSSLTFSSHLVLAQSQIAGGRVADANRSVREAARVVGDGMTPSQKQSLQRLQTRIDTLDGRSPARELSCASDGASLTAQTPSLSDEWLDCGVTLYLAGRLPRAAECARHALPSLDRAQKLESVWMARAILAAAAPSDGAIRSEARRSLTTFEQSLSPQDLAAYRKLPLVARLQKHLL